MAPEITGDGLDDRQLGGRRWRQQGRRSSRPCRAPGEGGGGPILEGTSGRTISNPLFAAPPKAYAVLRMRGSVAWRHRSVSPAGDDVTAAAPTPATAACRSILAVGRLRDGCGEHYGRALSSALQRRRVVTSEVAQRRCHSGASCSSSQVTTWERSMDRAGRSVASSRVCCWSAP
jgi:hypothetical protein